MISSKKAAAHVEIILAFILFVGFVFFLIYFIQPFKTQTLQDAVLVSFKDSFFEFASANLTSVLVNFSENRQSNGQYLPCRLNETFVPGTADMKVINLSTVRPEFSYLYYSDARDIVDLALISSLSVCGSKDFPMGNINNLVVLSDDKLRNMSIKYVNDYDGLKQDLGLLPNVDFSVLVEGSYSMDKVAPEQANEFVGVYRRLVLYSDGTLINKDFIVKVW